MKPCKSINCFYDPEFRVDVTEQIRRVADGGFLHLDMNFWDWSHDVRSPFMQDDWREWILRIDDQAKRCGVCFTQAHAHVYNFYDFDRDSVHERQILRSIEGAGMLRIPWIVLHLSGKQAIDADEEGRKAYFSDNIAYIRDKCEYALRYNVGIAIENMSNPSRSATTAEDLVQVIDGVQMPNIGACWDTGHAHIAKQDQYTSLCTLGYRLHALHIADNHGVTDEHTIPFVGSVDWHSVVKALREIRYPGDFTYEAHMFVRNLPEPCKNAGLQLMVRMGEYFCSLAE
ncbi:MAG: sugar phosphate isomerase/epimerase family protein [Christensenellales bacterium]